MRLERLVLKKHEIATSVRGADGDRTVSVRPMTDAENADLGYGPRMLYEIFIERAK